jgi:tetratricopeptide (TPR) repeat protein
VTTRAPAALKAFAPRAVIALATGLVFARAVPYPFARSWDDARFILDNRDVLEPSWPAFVRMWTSVQFEAYHPLHLLSYWLDVPWFGPAPWVVHLTSLTLWVLGLWIVYGWLVALRLPPWAAVVTTLLFGLHPVQVEVVSWASGRKDVLALLFGAACLRFAASSERTWDRAGAGAFACYVLALLSKTTALPLPLFALAIDVLVRGVSFRRALWRQAPSCVLGVAVSAGVLWIWREHAMVRSNLGGPELALLRASQTLGHQLLTAIWPGSNAPMYATDSIVHASLGRSLAALAYVIACALSLRARKRIPGLVPAGLLGFGLLLLPASNLVPLYFPLQDRYLSLPLLGLCVAFAGFGLPLPGRAPARRPQLQSLLALGGACALLLAARPWQYEGDWQSELRLWGHAAATQPDSDYAFLKLGEVRRDAGEFEGAIAAYHGAIRVAPLRKLAYAALFEAVARRDEKLFHLHPSRARELARVYYDRLDHPEALRELLPQLWSLGYQRASELPLAALLAYQPLPDSALQHAAISALREGRTTMARFYAHQLKDPPETEPLRQLYHEPYLAVVP